MDPQGCVILIDTTWLAQVLERDVINGQLVKEVKALTRIRVIRLGHNMSFSRILLQLIMILTTGAIVFIKINITMSIKTIDKYSEFT